MVEVEATAFTGWKDVPSNTLKMLVLLLSSQLSPLHKLGYPEGSTFGGSEPTCVGPTLIKPGEALLSAK